MYPPPFSLPQSGLLQCACTTADCEAEGANRCVATSMCYVQYLDRGDGASPWSRGCIDGIANSLLCENQPPAAAAAVVDVATSGKNGAWKSGKGKRKSNRDGGGRGGGGGGRGAGAPLLWPLIHCCSTSFCNSEEFSASYPIWIKKKFGKSKFLFLFHFFVFQSSRLEDFLFFSTNIPPPPPSTQLYPPSYLPPSPSTPTFFNESSSPFLSETLLVSPFKVER